MVLCIAIESAIELVVVELVQHREGDRLAAKSTERTMSPLEHFALYPFSSMQIELGIQLLLQIERAGDMAAVEDDVLASTTSEFLLLARRTYPFVH